jgi:CheY-like chemotaxis protein
MSNRTSDVKQPVRILVVEDTVDLLYGLKDFLEREGYSVTTATNGVEGLQALEAHPDMPDLVLLDIMMPEMDGITFMGELRQKPQYQHIPIIVLSARTGSKSEALDAGAALFIMKPFAVTEILIGIAGVLATRAIA